MSSETGGAAATDAQRFLKVELQLYKVKEGRYLLDVLKVYGELYAFLDLCSRLTTVFSWRSVSSSSLFS